MTRKIILFRLFLLLLLLLISPLTTRAEETEGYNSDSNSYRYIGILGNISKSNFFDRDGDLTDGDKKSDTNLSLMFGVESQKNIIESGNFKFLVDWEIHFDNINKTIMQSNQRYYKEENKNAGKEIYTINFILGTRLKIGFEFFKRINLYGFIGLNYWDKHFDIGIDYDILGINRLCLNFSSSYGFGGGINLTKNIELNFNYMKFPNTSVFPDDIKGYNTFEYDNLKINISVITFGLKYKF